MLELGVSVQLQRQFVVLCVAAAAAVQPALLWCHWLLVVKYFRKWEPHWTRELRAAHCDCISSRFSFIRLSHDRPLRNTFLSLILQCLNSPPVCCEPVYGYWHLLMLLLLCLFWQRTSSLNQLPVEDLKDPLPPQWKCYMSPQGRRYYVNTINNGKSQRTGPILFLIGMLQWTFLYFLIL